MVELASPKGMVLNAVYLAAVAAIVVFVADLSVETALTVAAENPLFAALVVLLAVAGILLKKPTGNGGVAD